MVAPVNRLPQPAASVCRAAVANDIAFEAVVAARELLKHDDPKVVLGAVKMIFEFEKLRMRMTAKLGYDPLAAMFDDPPAAPQVSEQSAGTDPEPAPTAEDEPGTRPEPPRDRRPPCPPVVVGGRLRGVVEPSISSFLPPNLTGSRPPCPQPTLTPASSPTPPS